MRAPEPAPDAGASLARSLLTRTLQLSLLYLAAAAAVWWTTEAGTGLWVGAGLGLLAAWLKAAHLARWLQRGGGMPGTVGLLVSLAVFGSAGAAAGLHSKSALAAALSAFAVPYLAAIMVAAKEGS